MISSGLQRLIAALSLCPNVLDATHVDSQLSVLASHSLARCQLYRLPGSKEFKYSCCSFDSFKCNGIIDGARVVPWRLDRRYESLVVTSHPRFYERCESTYLYAAKPARYTQLSTQTVVFSTPALNRWVAGFTASCSVLPCRVGCTHAMALIDPPTCCIGHSRRNDDV